MIIRLGYFKWVMRTVVPVLYVLLARVVPTGKVVAFISFPDVADNALAVYRQMVRRGDRDDALVWLVADVGKARRRLETLVDDAFVPVVVKKNSLKGLLIFLRSKHVFFTHGHYWFVRRIPGERRLINLWHGMPLKAIGLLDGKLLNEVQASDLVVASSRFFGSLMGRAFGLSADDVLVSGLPRCDQLVGEPSGRVRALLARLRTDGQKVVIWMPTYHFSTFGEVRSDSRSTKEAVAANFVAGLQVLSRLGVEWRCHIIAKLHPMDFLNGIALPGFENITLVNDRSEFLDSVELYDLLSGVDGLITDVSSVCFDFMATERPILITKDSLSDYARPLLFDPEEIFSATFTSLSWDGAASFFSAVASGRKVEMKGAGKFCEFPDQQSSMRLLAGVEALSRRAG